MYDTDKRSSLGVLGVLGVLSVLSVSDAQRGKVDNGERDGGTPGRVGALFNILVCLCTLIFLVHIGLNETLGLHQSTAHVSTM